MIGGEENGIHVVQRSAAKVEDSEIYGDVHREEGWGGEGSGKRKER